MRKYGRHEMQPAPKAAAKHTVKKSTDRQPKVKNMLLQTYLTSLLCLVVCVVMFFGASYAWFSSEVTNTGNEIYVGTLKVGLYKESKIAATDTDGATETVVMLDLSESENKLFGNSIRWEPGYTALETVQIVNEGDLAFKYVMTFTDATLAADSINALTDVAEHFDVWVFSHRANNAAPTAKAYAEITEATGWKAVGTLAEVLEGKVVLDGIMETVRDTDPVNDSTFDGVKTGKDTYTIALHMKEEANADIVAGQKISLNVKLVAYQLASETDGFGNSNYDSSVEVASDADTLKTLLAGSKNVVLASNLELKTDERVTMSAPMLDGNGKTITYKGDKVNNASAGVVTTSGGKIANLTITGGDNGRALYVTDLKSDLVVSNCVLSGAYAFNINSAKTNDNAIISFIDTTFSTWTSYANVAKHAYFTDCTFGSVLRPFGDTTLTNCEFTGETLDVSELVAGETVTLINCTYKGQLIARAVLTANADGTVTVTEGTTVGVAEVNGVKTVVLANG